MGNAVEIRQQYPRKQKHDLRDAKLILKLMVDAAHTTRVSRDSSHAGEQSRPMAEGNGRPLE